MNGSRMAPSSCGTRARSSRCSVYGARSPVTSCERHRQATSRTRRFPYLSTLELRVGPAPVFAQRISWVGELGWELWVEPRWAWPRGIDSWTPAGPTVSSPAATGCSRASDPSAAIGRSGPTSPPATRRTRRACPSASTYPRTSWDARRSWPGARSVRRCAFGRSSSASRDYVPIYGGEAVRVDGRCGRARAELCVRVHRATEHRVRVPPRRARRRYDRGRRLRPPGGGRR